MEGKWKLHTIYTGFDSEQYLDDMAQLSQVAEKIRKDSTEAGTVNGMELKEDGGDEKPVNALIKTYLKNMEKFQVLYSRLYAYSSLRISVNVNDEEALCQGRKLELLSASLASAKALFSAYIKSVDGVLGICREDEELKDYEFYIQKIFDSACFGLTSGEEAIVASMAITGSKAWSRLQADISSETASSVIEDGKEPGELKEILKQRFLSEQENCKSYAKISAAALNHIKGEVLYVSGLRGYESPLCKTLKDYHMDREIFNSLIESIEEYLPRLCKYYKIKAKALGYEEGLPYYAREVSIVNVSKTYEIKEAERLILNAFHNFSSRMYEFGKRAFNEGWIDYAPVIGKTSGASCDGIYGVKESRIRMNYHNTLADVNTLAHELGHGYHNLNLFDESVLNNCYDMPVAETASKFSEIIFREEMKKELKGREKLYIEDFMLSSFINTIVDIQSRFYFEDDFFAIRSERELTVEEIHALMEQAQIKSYGDSLDKHFLNPYMWLNKPHYYFPERNYYNFPYSFGTLLSIGMYQQYEADKTAFIKRYDIFLKSTGKMGIYDLCKLLSIDVKNKDFWRGTLERIVGLIESLEKSGLQDSDIL